MGKSDFDKLIDRIKEKEELSGISSEAIGDLLRRYLRINKLDLEAMSNKDLEIIKKDIRSQLRIYVGRFHKSSSLKIENLKELDFSTLIKTHISTKERLESYEILLNILGKVNPKIILDLGCGLNPLIIAKEGIRYYAVDINEADLKIVKKYFSLKRIEGEVLSKDIRKIEEADLPEADICLILKVFDLIDRKGHKGAERILDTIRAPHFIISFPTKTLSGKPMNHPQRGWIERLLTRKGWPFEIYKCKNEIFYLVKKLKE
ncbi:MAG: hypothetical protein Q8Q31_01700 [Nanoarchaeota archaeon]|nr:hypothetical protein [Nanoarchaeota archaeon]